MKVVRLPLASLKLDPNNARLHLGGVARPGGPMKVVRLPLASLKLDPNNARLHPERNMEAIVSSLKKFGQVEPLVVQASTKVVIGGNGRLEAMRAMGWEEADVVLVDVDDAKARSLGVALNRTAELAGWDDEQLAETLRWLSEQEEIVLPDDEPIDVSLIEATGFSVSEVDAYVRTDRFKDKDVDALPENAETRCKPGDLWLLGKHRLLCGDSTNVQHVERLMAGEKAELCFTSPPYNAGTFKVTGKSAAGKAMPRDAKYLSVTDDLTEEGYEQLLQDILATFVTVCDVVMLNVGILEPNKRAVLRFLNKNLELFKDTIYWRKSTSTPHIQPGILTMLVEPIFCFGTHNSRQFKNGSFKGNLGNVIEGSNASGNDQAKIHAATFPVYLPEWAVQNFTSAGAGVVDAFLGTGTTLIACEKTSRRCFGMEIDPHYCDVILARWEAFTGEKAVLAGERLDTPAKASNQ